MLEIKGEEMKKTFKLRKKVKRNVDSFISRLKGMRSGN